MRLKPLNVIALEPGLNEIRKFGTDQSKIVRVFFSFLLHPSGHLGEWATPWSAEEMMDGQRQRVDIPEQGGLRRGLQRK